MEMEDFERRFGRASREPLQAILDQHDTVTREVLVEMWESLHESCEGDVRRSSCYARLSIELDGTRSTEDGDRVFCHDEDRYYCSTRAGSFSSIDTPTTVRRHGLTVVLYPWTYTWMSEVCDAILGA